MVVFQVGWKQDFMTSLSRPFPRRNGDIPGFAAAGFRFLAREMPNRFGV
jgi:hypothetical protein